MGLSGPLRLSLPCSPRNDRRMPLLGTLSFLMPQCLLPSVELNKALEMFLPRLTTAQAWGNSACAESGIPEALQAPTTPGSDPEGWITLPSSGVYGTEELSVVLSPEQKTLLSKGWSVS